MFTIMIWLLIFSGISISQVQIELPKEILNLVNAILKNTTDKGLQNSLLELLQNLPRGDAFDNIIEEISEVLYPKKIQDVRYHMYIGNIRNYTIFSDSNVTNIPKLDKKAKYAVLFHGWKGNKNFIPKQGITKLIHKGYIVISADYPSAMNDPLYILSASVGVIQTGKKIGKTLKSLHIPESQMTFVGHSLGGHIAAGASDYLSQKCENKKVPKKCKVAKIYGLDAVGPISYLYKTPLSKKSANYVSAFHTSFYGAINSIGHVDYYAADITGACARSFGTDSHNASIHYFVNGIDKPKLYKASNCKLSPLGKKLKDLFKLSNVRNSNARLAYMNFNTPTSVTGIYCLTLKKDSAECTNHY